MVQCDVMALQNPVASTLAAVKQALLSGDLETGVRHILRMTVPAALPEGERQPRATVGRGEQPG